MNVKAAREKIVGNAIFVLKKPEESQLAASVPKGNVLIFKIQHRPKKPKPQDVESVKGATLAHVGIVLPVKKVIHNYAVQSIVKILSNLRLTLQKSQK